MTDGNFHIGEEVPVARDLWVLARLQFRGGW